MCIFLRQFREKCKAHEKKIGDFYLLIIWLTVVLSITAFVISIVAITMKTATYAPDYRIEGANCIQFKQMDGSWGDAVCMGVVQYKWIDTSLCIFDYNLQSYTNCTDLLVIGPAGPQGEKGDTGDCSNLTCPTVGRVDSCCGASCESCNSALECIDSQCQLHADCSGGLIVGKLCYIQTGGTFSWNECKSACETMQFQHPFEIAYIPNSTIDELLSSFLSEFSWLGYQYSPSEQTWTYNGQVAAYLNLYPYRDDSQQSGLGKKSGQWYTNHLDQAQSCLCMTRID